MELPHLLPRKKMYQAFYMNCVICQIIIIVCNKKKNLKLFFGGFDSANESVPHKYNTLSRKTNL